VAEQIATLAKGDKKAGREQIEIEAPQLIVGGRRVREREGAAKRLRELGFLGPAQPRDKPAFVVATSAGEVGVDLDADHMVCDLVPWERMVQRLGRVNRRGGRQAQVIVFDTSATEKDEDRAARLVGTRSLLGRIEADLGGEAGPAALLELRAKVGPQQIENASTRTPLRPALTRAVVDAWSMTSLEEHSGRPEIEPWLRGWVEDEKPQTTIVWRKHLPVSYDGDGSPVVVPANVQAFLDAAPPRESEKLQTESYRVVDWLEKLTKGAAERASPASKDTADGGKGPAPARPDADAPVEAAPAEIEAADLAPRDIVAFLLSSRNAFEKSYTWRELGLKRDGNAKKAFVAELSGKTLVVDRRIGGLGEDGMLDEGRNAPLTADAGDAMLTPEKRWDEAVGFRISVVKFDDENIRRYRPSGGWRSAYDFPARRDADGEIVQILRIERFRTEATDEDARSTANALQLLSEHQRAAAARAQQIGTALGLPAVARQALVVAARLHDEGKRAERWQRAFKAPRERDESGVPKKFAKTPGPIDHDVLDGYRHEFGSLPAIERDPEFLALPEEWRELVLHMVAAHHGNARPLIATKGCEDAPPTALAARARAVALRFARLQQRWGPWGLAWWETLLRAADQQASRDGDEASAAADTVTQAREAGNG
jgi:CRISPR-associated endonuclease/helicase Cas3